MKRFIGEILCGVIIIFIKKYISVMYLLIIPLILCLYKIFKKYLYIFLSKDIMANDIIDNEIKKICNELEYKIKNIYTTNNNFCFSKCKKIIQYGICKKTIVIYNGLLTRVYNEQEIYSLFLHDYYHWYNHLDILNSLLYFLSDMMFFILFIFLTVTDTNMYI